MSIKHFFYVRKVDMSDGSDLYELVTPGAERVASASTEDPLQELEMTLNLALTDVEESNSDVVVEA